MEFEIASHPVTHLRDGTPVHRYCSISLVHHADRKSRPHMMGSCACFPAETGLCGGG